MADAGSQSSAFEAAWSRPPAPLRSLFARDRHRTTATDFLFRFVNGAVASRILTPMPTAEAASPEDDLAPRRSRREMVF